jgi:hypothetical protein
VSLSSEDETMLRECLAARPDEDEERRFNARAFREMLERDFPLSDKQRTWVRNVYEKLFDVPQYENLISSGKAPRGREVPLPEVLKHLPKKPPGRQP